MGGKKDTAQGQGKIIDNNIQEATTLLTVFYK